MIPGLKVKVLTPTHKNRQGKVLSLIPVAQTPLEYKIELIDNDGAATSTSSSSTESKPEIIQVNSNEVHIQQFVQDPANSPTSENYKLNGKYTSKSIRKKEELQKRKSD